MIEARLRRTAMAAALALATFCATRLARAESMLVVLARPANEGMIAAEVVNRIRGELLADGFKVVMVEPVAKADRVASLTGTGHAAGAAVAAGLFVEESASSVEMDLVDAITGRVLTRGIEARRNSPEQAPEVLARRTVDLLRASLLDFLIETLRVAVTAPREPARAHPTVESNDHAAGSGWGLEGGFGVLGGFGGLGPALLPLVRVRRALSEAVHVRITGAWLGTQPHVDAAATGTARVEQGVVLLECAARFLSGSRLRPLASMGAGAYYVGVTGSGISPYPDAQSSAFAFAFDAGVGVATPIASHVEMVVEAHALVTAPGLAVRFAGVDEARIGRPSLLGTITIAGSI